MNGWIWYAMKKREKGSVVILPEEEKAVMF